MNQALSINDVDAELHGMLGGLLKRIDRSVRTFSVNDLESLDEASEALG